MKRSVFLFPAALSLLLALLSAAAETAGASGFSSTASLKKQVRELQSVPEDDAAQKRRIRQSQLIRAHIDDFIVHQIEAAPDISGADLQAQLEDIFCIPEGTQTCEQDESTPKVFTALWGPKTERRQFVVSYQLYLGFMGNDSSLVVIESYLWDKASQDVRLTSHGGGEFNGDHVGFQELACYPPDDEHWILVSGEPLGWSGRAYAGKARLYRVGDSGVSTAWTTRTLPNLRIQKNELGWEVVAQFEH